MTAIWTIINHLLVDLSGPTVFILKPRRAADLGQVALGTIEQASGPSSVNGLLILDISGKLCVSQDEVRKRFGLSPELIMPSPHAPPSKAIYWAYHQDSYVLNFGFSSNEPPGLVSVTLDAIPNR